MNIHHQNKITKKNLANSQHCSMPVFSDTKQNQKQKTGISVSSSEIKEARLDDAKVLRALKICNSM